MGLENLDAWKLAVLVLVGLLVVGPDKLPKAISDGLRVLRQLRAMARNATAELSDELGTDIRLEDLNPKTLIRKHLLSEDDEAALRAPVRQLIDDMRGAAIALDPTVSPAATAAPERAVARARTVDWDAT